MVERGRRFVYGRFHWPTEKVGRPKELPLLSPALAPSLSAWDQFAIEIIREYGANELIGKLYGKSVANAWTPIEPSRAASSLDWFKWYQKLDAHTRQIPGLFSFEMEGSGTWNVLHFRNESDQTGPYVAVALRYANS